MQLTKPQPPQADEFAALRNGLNGFNEAITGQLHCSASGSPALSRMKRVWCWAASWER